MTIWLLFKRTTSGAYPSDSTGGRLSHRRATGVSGIRAKGGPSRCDRRVEDMRCLTVLSRSSWMARAKQGQHTWTSGGVHGRSISPCGGEGSRLRSSDASHNPKENGMKMCGHGRAAMGDAESRRHSRMVVGWHHSGLDRPRDYETSEMLDDYVDREMGFMTRRDLPVKWCSSWKRHGRARAPCLFDRLPCKTTRLCFEVDGTFPNHEANPLIEENRRDIVERVIAEKADIGIAWDGDADRCFFIDGAGEFIAGDFVTALLAESFLMKSPGETIIYDVRASYAVKDLVASTGARRCDSVGTIHQCRSATRTRLGGRSPGTYSGTSTRGQRLHPALLSSS